MIYDPLRNGVVPMLPTQFLRHVAAGALGMYGDMRALTVLRHRVVDAAAAQAMGMSQAQAECAVGSISIEYSDIASRAQCAHFWPRGLRYLVERPAGARALMGTWRNEPNGPARALLMAVDVPQDVHLAVAQRTVADPHDLFAMLPMSDRIEVVDESASTSQRTLTVYFDGRPMEVVDNGRSWDEPPDPRLGFAARTVEQACNDLKVWFVQRNLMFSTDEPRPAGAWTRDFDNLRAGLILKDRLAARAVEAAAAAQAQLDRCLDADPHLGSPGLLRDVERPRA